MTPEPEQPLSKTESKRIELGETFAPFGGLTEFLPTTGIQEGDLVPVLVVPIELQGIEGFIRARANTWDLSEFETPLGEVLTTIARLDGNEEYRDYPVDLDVVFNVTSKEDFYELGDYSCRIDFPNGQSYDIDCVDSNSDEADVPVDIERRGRYRTHSSEFVRDGNGVNVLLPRDLTRLAWIKMTFGVNL